VRVAVGTEEGRNKECDVDNSSKIANAIIPAAQNETDLQLTI
jgi:hypothetical protein